MSRAEIRSEDHPTFGQVYHGELSFETVQVLRDEDPCDYLATGRDEQARIKRLESIEAIAVWRKAEHALADYLGLEPRDAVLDALDLRAEMLRDEEFAHAHVAQIETIDEVQVVLEGEVARENTRKSVVGACETRKSELRTESEDE